MIHVKVVCSSIFPQVLLKSVQWFCRCGWSKIALPHYFGHWLIQQLVLPTVQAVIAVVQRRFNSFRSAAVVVVKRI